MLDGDHEVNEVWFSDVIVPVENLVGEENKGWTCAKYLLSYERTNIAGVGASMAAFERLKEVARTTRRNGSALIEDPLFAARMAEVEIDLENMRTTNLRVLMRRAAGRYAQPFLDEALEGGFNGEPVGPGWAAPVASQYFNNRKLSIFGGSNEVQREIIGKSMMGL